MSTGIPQHTRTLESIGRFWRGERTGAVCSFVTWPDYDQMLIQEGADLDAIADRAVACLRADAAFGEPFVLPTVRAGFGSISMARLFGGKVIPPRDGGGISIEPVARRADELAGLRPCAFEESDFQRAVNLYRRVCERLGTDEVFLRGPDFQGPMNTLAMVMDQEELLVGLYTEPEAIHAALDLITTTLIAYHQRFRRELGGGKVVGSTWPHTFLPEALGAALTQDMMPLLGPDAYRKFEVPCLRRIAEAFGGVQIHCCGKYAQHLPALKDSGVTIRGLEFHHPFTPFAEIHGIFGDSIVYIPYVSGDCKDFADYPSFAADLVRQGTPETRFWFAQVTGWCDPAALRQAIGGRKRGTR